MTDAIQDRKSEYLDVVTLQSIATSPGSHNIWQVTIGSGDIANITAVLSSVVLIGKTLVSI